MVILEYVELKSLLRTFKPSNLPGKLDALTL